MRRICENYAGISPADIGEMTFDQIFVLSAKEETLRDLQRFVVRRASSIPEIRDKLSPVPDKSLAELLKLGYSPDQLGLAYDVP